MLERDEYKQIEQYATSVAQTFHVKHGLEAADMVAVLSNDELSIEAQRIAPDSLIPDGKARQAVGMVRALLQRAQDAVAALADEPLRLITPTETADFLYITRAKVQTLCRQGELDWCWDIYGMTRLITRASLLDLKKRGVNVRSGRPPKALAA